MKMSTNEAVNGQTFSLHSMIQQRVPFEKLMVAQLVKLSAFTEYEGSLPCSQKLINFRRNEQLT
jgi:hypothetical protein